MIQLLFLCLYPCISYCFYLNRYNLNQYALLSSHLKHLEDATQIFEERPEPKFPCSIRDIGLTNISIISKFINLLALFGSINQVKGELRNYNTTSIIFVDGYLIPSSSYASISNDILISIPSLSKIIHESSSMGEETIVDSAKRIVNFYLHSSEKFIVIGHSRGGAVSLEILKLMNDRIKCLILLDPVDDASKSTISNLHYYDFKDIPILVVSLPYGGKSKYYNINFSSSCAPIDRSSSVIYESIKSKKKSLVTLLDIGHLQFLDSSDNVTIDNICAKSLDLNPRECEIVISKLITLWIKESLSKNISPSESAFKLFDELLRKFSMRFEILIS